MVRGVVGAVKLVVDGGVEAGLIKVTGWTGKSRKSTAYLT